LLIGVIAIILGVVILWRTISVAISPPGLMVGFAFLGLGVYRLWLGYTRLKQLREKR
jgi:uncharacterized membrane protein HdeD (DUF308 family)